MSSDAGLAPLKRALISVSDKTGIVDFTRALIEHGVEILSTGGTCRLLREAGLAVTEVSDHTGFPEMMDGRVKTLHPKIHGGILGRRGVDDSVMTAHDIPAIDLVVVNLYPFEATVARADCTLADAVENIDIGGPTMVRAAAKNHRDVAILVSTQDYAAILEELTEHNGHTTLKTRFNLAIRAYEHTAAYDGMIANHFGCLVEGGSADYPRTFSLQLEKVQEMRYGENPHQSAAFYREAVPKEVGISSAKQLQGKALSYNNVADTDAALECVKSFSEPACVIVKHANPCGVAVADTLNNAYNLAFHTDSESAFGGIIAFNRELDADTASAIVERQFVEVIIAPSVSEDAVTAVATKKNVLLLQCGTWGADRPQDLDYKRVNGGLLIQYRDNGMIIEQDLKVVSNRIPSDIEMSDMLFAWKVAKMVKSNAIIYAKNNQTIGIGAGQMSRIYSAKIAASKAIERGFKTQGCSMASDAFFPFRDGIDAAAEIGITSVIQPGGSMRDQEVIDAANEEDMSMLFTGIRHFRH